MPKFIIIGPLTRDTISRDGLVYHSTGGAVYYQASVLSNLDVDVTAVITLSREDEELLNAFPQNVDIIPLFFDKTMKFENIYPNHNPNHRIQRATVPENPVKPENLPDDIESYDAVLLCPLSPSDIPIETIEHIFHYNVPIYMGAQGYLRQLKDHRVILKPWNNFEKFLRFVQMIFIDEVEAKVMVGSHKLDKIGNELSTFGPQEVIITCGDRGAVIYSSISEHTYKIPAFTPMQTMDPTGLGDTYMAAYARKRMETSDPETCGIFASMVSTMKLEKIGAFQGNITMVNERLGKF
ncbi:PfkB family carbohydrate kinase [Methanobacterium spitsbergense]|uniref:Carbohydrate kinase n=1 Tax=Methanobacterium spitsbergense TaxID=2874285 RepID=A0A8T5UPQ0_9EURY|nr:PfkB family carbohydrate kinase [Methanobacterium spitsbergense]MBZ2165634.1 carbohydrate kinase [Methanobacterium spitsbergense]